MKKHNDSLRGYGHEVHIKNNFTCQYCGYDGRSFPNWFQLSVEHIKPRSAGGDDSKDNLTTVCSACNSITSRMTFEENLTSDEIMRMKIERVKERQSEYFDFWKENVAPLFIEGWKKK